MSPPFNNLPRPGQMGFTTIEGPVGIPIAIGQKILRLRHPWHRHEHVFRVLNNNQIIEAMPGGARIMPLEYYTETHRAKTTVYTNLKLTDQQVIDCDEAARALEGIPYNFITYGVLALKRFGISSLKIDRMISNMNFMLCSQLADESYARGGVHLYQDRRLSQNVIPWDLYTDFYLTDGIWPKV